MQNKNTHIIIPESETAGQDPGGFSCIFINGESFSDKEENYSEILKHTYEYKPELYEHVFRYLDY